MIRSVLNNEILKKITAIEENRFSIKGIELPQITMNRLRKNSKKKIAKFPRKNSKQQQGGNFHGRT